MPAAQPVRGKNGANTVDNIGLADGAARQRSDGSSKVNAELGVNFFEALAWVQPTMSPSPAKERSIGHRLAHDWAGD